MNPSDALPQDWGMYYDQCWMRHRAHGVGRVRVIGGELFLEKNIGEDPIRVKPSYLECWWPRPGAFNVGNAAVYISRRTIRNMRKSAIGIDHYFIKWGTMNPYNIMPLLRDGPNHIRLETALRDLDAGVRQSAAVGRDIIIEKDDNRYVVIFRGIEVGTWDHGFIPMFSENPLTGRILKQLEGSE